jgi:mannose-6-phosphate isomerase-like protein (cupin superfamily)
MPDKHNYIQQMNIRYGHLELIDVPEIVRECKEKWFNQSLTQVNDSVARIGIVEGEYHWHKHDNDDEFFFVLEGKLFIDLEGRTMELGPMQGVTITKGVMHRTRAPQKTIMLMIETLTIDPIGD